MVLDLQGVGILNSFCPGGATYARRRFLTLRGGCVAEGVFLGDLGPWWRITGSALWARPSWAACGERLALIGGARSRRRVVDSVD